MTDETTRPVALVTGARRGIGRGCAVALAEAGFDIVVHDLEPSTDLGASTDAVAAAAAAGGRAAAVVGDIADVARHGALLDSAVAAFGRLDCLVNNAGGSVLSRGDILDVSVESYDRCQAINGRGTFFLTQRFARYLLEAAPPALGHRSVVVISSANADVVSPDRAEYCISKAGLAMMAQLFAVRLAPEGIGVYDVRPGIIRTEMTAPAQDKYDALFASGAVPMPHWGRPADVGRVVAAAAGGALPYTVGQVLRVDGGLAVTRL